MSTLSEPTLERWWSGRWTRGRLQPQAPATQDLWPHLSNETRVLQVRVLVCSDQMFSLHQMEELVGTRHPHTSHDLLLLLHHLPGPHGAYDDCEYSTLPTHCFLLRNLNKFTQPSICSAFLPQILFRLSCYCGFGAFQLLGNSSVCSISLPVTFCRPHESELRHTDC